MEQIYKKGRLYDRGIASTFRASSSRMRYGRPSQLLPPLPSSISLRSPRTLRPGSSRAYRVTWNYNSVKLTLHMLIIKNRSVARGHLQGSPFRQRNMCTYVRSHARRDARLSVHILARRGGVRLTRRWWRPWNSAIPPE